MNTQADTLLGDFPEIELSEDLLKELNIETQEEEESQEETDDEWVPTLDDGEEQEQEEDKTVEYEDGEPEAIAIYTVMKEKGLVGEDAPFTGKWEDLDDLMSSYLPQKAAEAFIEQAPEKYRNLLAVVHNDGVEPTTEEIKKILTAMDEDFADTTVDFKTDDDAREYLEKVYESKGMRKSAIKAQLDDIEDEDKLMDEAKKEYEAESKNRQSSLGKLREEQEAKREAKKVEQTKFVDSIKQELVSLEWKPERKQAVAKVISNVPGILAKVEKSAKAVVQLADFISYYDEKTGVFNMDNYKKQALSKNLQKESKSLVQSAFANVTKAHGKMKHTEDIGDLVPIFD